MNLRYCIGPCSHNVRAGALFCMYYRLGLFPFMYRAMSFIAAEFSLRRFRVQVSVR